MKVKAIDEDLYLKERKIQLKNLVSQKDMEKKLNNLKIKITILNEETIQATTSSAKTVNLSDSIQNYDMIYVSLRGDWNHMFSAMILPIFLTSQHFNIQSSSGYYVRGYCQFPTDTTFKVTPTHAGGWGGVYLNAIVGIKFNQEQE